MSIVQLIDNLGAFVASALEQSGLRPLNDGGVLLGAEFVDDTRAPNSIVFVPVRTQFGPPLAVSAGGNSAPTNGTPFRTRARPRHSRAPVVEVHVWGAATPTNPRDDYDVTEYLAETVVRCAYLLASLANTRPGQGTWVDQRDTSGQKSKLGHYFVFELELRGPVVDQPVNFVPPGTRMVPTLNVTPLTNTQ